MLSVRRERDGRASQAFAAILVGMSRRWRSPRPCAVRRGFASATIGVALALVATSCGPAGDSDVPPSPFPARTGQGTRVSVSGFAIDWFSARLSWRQPSNATAVQIWRDSRLIDRVAAAKRTYTDRLLWERSRYDYAVVFVDPRGRAVGSYRVPVNTPALTTPFPRLYADSSFWNTPIAPDARAEPGSATIISNSLVRYASTANLVNSLEHGYPIAYADPASTRFPIGCTKYDCQTNVSFRIPAYARPNTGSDGHLVVLDPATGEELDMFAAACCWRAASRYATSMGGSGAICPPGSRCNGAVAAGFAEAAGIIRPEEIAQGHIDHALAVATPYTRADYIACPATHTDGQYSATAIPEGARIQLDPGFDVQAQKWPRWQKIIATAFQVYGGYIADTSGSLAVRAEANLDRGYNAWTKAGVPSGSPSLADLPWSRFRLLAVTQC